MKNSHFNLMLFVFFFFAFFNYVYILTALHTEYHELGREKHFPFSHEIIDHSCQGCEYDLNVKWEKGMVTIDTNISCDLLNSNILKNDKWCHLPKSSKFDQIVLNKNKRNHDTWKDCTVVGSSLAMNHSHYVENTALFFVNYHDYESHFTLGPNVERNLVLHYGHYIHGVVADKKVPKDVNSKYDNVYFVISNVHELDKARSVLNCNAYRHSSNVKRMLFEEKINWEVFTGTAVIFSLLNKCDKVNVVGFYDNHNGIETQYSFDGNHNYKGNSHDFDILLLLKMCSFINFL